MASTWRIASSMLALVLASGASAQQPPLVQPYGANDYHGAGTVLNILPAGQKGVFNAADEAQMAQVCSPAGEPSTCSRDEADYPPYTIDQLLMYDGLLRGAPTLTPATLTDYYKDATFGVPANKVLRQYSPGGRAGVVVIRDSDFNVPRIYANNRHDAIFATGYVSAEDRLFLMDILRHVGRGRMSEFLGPSPANLAMDRDTYRVAGYTEAELQQMVDNLDDQYGSYGTLTQQGFSDFADGVNQYIQDMLLNPTLLPAEYVTLQQLPMQWKTTDTVAVATLITGIFGVGGGGELNNCRFLQELEQRYADPVVARQVFEDFQQEDDPEKPRTSDLSYPYLVQGAVDPAAVACPDPDTLAAAISGASRIAGDSVDGPGGPIPLFAHSKASNALVVGASRSATGHPLAVFGPQVSYFAPQILTELEVHAPGVPGDPLSPSIDARGAAFPGISLLVLLGRGRDFSWSATSAGSDLVDTIAAPLCEPSGAPPTLASRSYLYQGQCLPMYQRNDVWIAKPSAGGLPALEPPALPDPSQLPSPTPDLLNDPLFLIGAAAPLTGNVLVTAKVLRTVHGPVQAFATVNGQPVAYVRQRSTFLHEPDAAPSFLKLNSPDLVHDAASFQQAMGTVANSTFNWFYVDSKDIAYQVSGNYPIRAAGIDYDLPYFATGQWDWQNWTPATYTADRLPQSQIPHDLNPARGYMTSWNNAQAPGWNAADAELSYGPLHRVQPLSDRIAADASITLTELVQYMEDAGTVDLRGDKVVPVIAQLLGASTGNADADLGLSVLTAWAAAGAHRRDLDGDGVYDHAAAVALIDRWWVPLGDAVFDTLGADVRAAMPLGRHDAPGPVGSAFIAGWYGIVHKDLRGVIAGAPVAPFSRLYCGNGVLAACKAAVTASLAAAVQSLGPNPATWDVNEVGDHIQFAAAGTASVPDMQWVNRPTFQQVVEYRLDAQSPDTDADGSNDDADNCPYVANPAQEDTGGLATSTPDGIGNACQCGDVTGNGIVNGQDGNAISRHGIGATPNPLFAVPGNCDVTGNDQCNGQDANAVKRAAIGQPSPQFGQRCHNATGAPIPPGL